MWAPELETLDQLLRGDPPLAVIREIFSDDERFVQGVHGLLAGGDVQLIANGDTEVAQWRWQRLFLEGGVFNEIAYFALRIKPKGAARVAWLARRWLLIASHCLRSRRRYEYEILAPRPKAFQVERDVFEADAL